MPIGFICDHVEVLYDLDLEAASVARANGVTMRRAATVGDHPLFIRMIAELLRCGSIANRADEAPAGSGGMKHVVVIGGGIAGLAAAHRLTELAREDADPIQVTLLERSGRLGGPIETVCERGFVIECGADSFISEKPWALDLARRLGLEAELIPTGEMRRTMIVCRGRLTDIPAGFNLLAPIDLLPMFKSPILSLRGKLRLALELMLPRRVRRR